MKHDRTTASVRRSAALVALGAVAVAAAGGQLLTASSPALLVGAVVLVVAAFALTQAVPMLERLSAPKRTVDPRTLARLEGREPAPQDARPVGARG